MTDFRHNTLYYDVQQAASELDKSASEIDDMIRSGRLHAVSIGEKLVVPVQAIEDFRAGISVPDAKNRVMLEEGKSAQKSSLGSVHYYTPSQVAEMLSVDLFEVNRLVTRGELSAVSIDKHRWLPAKAVEDLVRQKYGPGKLTHTPQPRILDKSKDYYSVDEVAQRLGRGHHEIWRMVFMGKLRVDTVGEQRLFLKQSVDNLIRKPQSSTDANEKTFDPITSDGSAVTSLSDGSDHYTVVEAAEKLDKAVDDVWEMVYRGELSVSTINGERVFAKQAVNDLEHPEDHANSAQSESERHGTGEESEIQMSQDSEAAFAKDRYYTPGQAALLLGKDASEINRMIRRRELPVLRVNSYLWIPEQYVENLLTKSARHRWRKQENRPKAYRIRKSEIRKADPPKWNEQEADKNANEAEDSSNSVKSEAQVHLSTLEDASEVTSTPSQSEAGLKEEVEMLRDELRAEKERNQRLTEELEQKRADLTKDVQNARYEIAQLNAEIENLHRDSALQSETLREDLEEARRNRIESELRAKKLQDELEGEKRSRTGVKGVVESLRGLISHEDDSEEQQRDLELALEDAKRELEEEKNRQSTNGAWFDDLQSKLEQNEARSKELEKALSSETGKVLRLEEEKRTLDEVRRLLGASMLQPSEHAEAATSVDAHSGESEKINDGLLIATRHGQWDFRPPFALENDEIELLRLVAGENEITAEQIKTKSGRRRAADDLDELLDRLHEEGLEPIGEDNDVYRFDPNFLDDEK